jgi:hypothetical protein
MDERAQNQRKSGWIARLIHKVFEANGFGKLAALPAALFPDWASEKRGIALTYCQLYPNRSYLLM